MELCGDGIWGNSPCLKQTARLDPIRHYEDEAVCGD